MMFFLVSFHYIHWHSSPVTDILVSIVPADLEARSSQMTAPIMAISTMAFPKYPVGDLHVRKAISLRVNARNCPSLRAPSLLESQEERQTKIPTKQTYMTRMGWYFAIASDPCCHHFVQYPCNGLSRQAIGRLCQLQEAKDQGQYQTNTLEQMDMWSID